MIRKISLALLLLALLFSMAAQAEKSYSADRFDVDVQVQEDGSLLVEETVAFRFRGGPFSYVFRELPVDHTDGIVDIVAGADGAAWPEGAGPGQVEITGRDPIVITWHLSPTSDTTQVFTLAYRPLGVLRPGSEATVLEWQALPDEYDYDIASSRVVFSYPATAGLLNTPRVLSGKADVAAGEGRTVFTQGNLSAGDSLVVRLEYTPEAFDIAPPAWQARAEAQNSRAWIWISAAAVILLGGVAAVVLAARPYQQTMRKANSFLHRPPADLPPAMTGYLFNQNVSWQHGLATLLDLAARGLIRIEELGEKKWYRSSDFVITLLSRPAGLRLHENALLDILFTDESGVPQEDIRLSDMGGLVTSSRWKAYTEALKEEANVSGFVDAKAKQRGRQLVIWGVVLMLLNLPVLLMGLLLGPTFGFWPLILMGALFLVSLAALIFGGTISSLSPTALRLAEAYDPFRRFVSEVATDKLDIADPAYYEAYLPFAAAFGRAEAWVKRQASSDYRNVPAYFRSVSTGHEMASFVAVITAAGHSGGAADASASAGAAGAGAAGGGASGAG